VRVSKISIVKKKKEKKYRFNHILHNTLTLTLTLSTGGEIPEGYIDVTLPGGRKSTILHPAYPGSIYHATKCLDALMFQFYNKNDGVRCTDLHQGVVWGTNTEQVKLYYAYVVAQKSHVVSYL
jgi:UDP-sulfoquinovose synthase